MLCQGDKLTRVSPASEPCTERVQALPLAAFFHRNPTQASQQSTKPFSLSFDLRFSHPEGRSELPGSSLSFEPSGGSLLSFIALHTVHKCQDQATDLH